MSLSSVRAHRFLFEELVKRDFKGKYKRTLLGVLWSMLSPLLQLLVMSLLFNRFFAESTPHYTIYLFSGTLVFAYFSEATNQGMLSLEQNAHIIAAVNVPKHLFLLSKNVSSLINFALTMVIYALFALLDGIAPHPRMLTLLFPIACLMLINIGVGACLSALYAFFKDINYLYGIATMLLMYLSAIFYTVDRFTPLGQALFYLNPVYCVIDYFRSVVIRAQVPPLWHHAACLGHAALFLSLGALLYRRYGDRFIYYL